MNTKHLPLIVAIALPIIFIITLAITLSIPASKIKPEFNFIYTDISQEYYKNYNMVQYKNMYDIKDKKLVLVPIISQKEDIYNKTQIEYKNAPTLYHYDVKTNITKEVTFEEMQKNTFEVGPSSPDGYHVAYEYDNNGIFDLFGSDSQSGFYIKKENGKKLLTGITEGYYYGDDGFNIIGWVK